VSEEKDGLNDGRTKSEGETKKRQRKNEERIASIHTSLKEKKSCAPLSRAVS